MTKTIIKSTKKFKKNVVFIQFFLYFLNCKNIVKTNILKFKNSTKLSNKVPLI